MSFTIIIKAKKVNKNSAWLLLNSKHTFAFFFIFTKTRKKNKGKRDNRKATPPFEHGGDNGWMDGWRGRKG